MLISSKVWNTFVLVFMQEVGGRVLAQDLQEQIERTLDELACRCILELLALPLDKEYEHQREQGLQGLRALLWNVDADGNSPPLGGFTREELMKEAFSFMTAAEQVLSLTVSAKYPYCKRRETALRQTRILHCCDCVRDGRKQITGLRVRRFKDLLIIYLPIFFKRVWLSQSY